MECLYILSERGGVEERNDSLKIYDKNYKNRKMTEGHFCYGVQENFKEL